MDPGFCFMSLNNSSEFDPHLMNSPPDRKWIINPEEKTFSYEFSMATENTPLTRHLEVQLRKV